MCEAVLFKRTMSFFHSSGCAIDDFNNFFPGVLSLRGQPVLGSGWRCLTACRYRDLSRGPFVKMSVLVISNDISPRSTRWTMMAQWEYGGTALECCVKRWGACASTRPRPALPEICEMHAKRKFFSGRYYYPGLVLHTSQPPRVCFSCGHNTGVSKDYVSFSDRNFVGK